MKRYIRTKDNKIYYADDILVIHGQVFIYEDHYINEREFKNNISKEADTIKELIEVGDLVSYDNSTNNDTRIVREIVDNYLIIDYTDENSDIAISGNKVTELYTKQGKDYVLVWDKKREALILLNYGTIY